MNGTQSGWYSDPKGSYLYRYWNGTQWTDQVSNGGTHSGIDPDPLGAPMVTTPPAPGTAAPSATPPATPAPQPTIQVTQTRGSSVGTIIALILAVAVIVVVIALVVNSGDDSPSSGTDAPATTNPPATTTAE